MMTFCIRPICINTVPKWAEMDDPLSLLMLLCNSLIPRPTTIPNVKIEQYSFAWLAHCFKLFPKWEFFFFKSINEWYNGYYCNVWRKNVNDKRRNHLRSYRILEPIWISVGWERVMNFFVKDELWLPQMSIYFFKPWTLIISYRQETQQTYNEVNFCAKLIPSFKIRNCNNLLSNFYRSQFRS